MIAMFDTDTRFITVVLAVPLAGSLPVAPVAAADDADLEATNTDEKQGETMLQQPRTDHVDSTAVRGGSKP